MNFAGNFLLKVAQSPGCVRGLIRLHLSYCTMRTMFWLKELNFDFNQFCRGVIKTKSDKLIFISRNELENAKNHSNPLYFSRWL